MDRQGTQRTSKSCGVVDHGGYSPSRGGPIALVKALEQRVRPVVVEIYSARRSRNMGPGMFDPRECPDVTFGVAGTPVPDPQMAASSRR